MSWPEPGDECEHKDGRACVNQEDGSWASRKAPDAYDTPWCYDNEHWGPAEGPMPEFLWVPCSRTHVVAHP